MNNATVVLPLFLIAVSGLSQVTVVDGITYSNTNSNVRQFRMFYPAGTPVNAALPIVVWIHGGGWSKGSRGDGTITPKACNGDQTIACWLADHGYVVFSIDYTLVSKTVSGSNLTISAPNTVTSGLSQRFS
jgi:acetyl esterase/lipase